MSINIRQLAVEYDKSHACGMGYADGDFGAFIQWLNWFLIEGDKPRALVPPGQEPDAVSSLGGDCTPFHWFKLRDGRVVGVSRDHEPISPGDVDGGYIIQPGFEK